jgi:hypothetical protein
MSQPLPCASDAQRALQLVARVTWHVQLLPRPILLNSTRRMPFPSRLQAFYRAEPSLRILLLHPSNTYIAVYDLPKIANLKKLYPELYREQPVLVGNNKE